MKVNFTKEIPLNEISENLKILLKKNEGKVNFTKEIPVKKKYENLRFSL